MTVRIVEVIGRSVQGITRPFICRGDDGQQYFVKGNGAGRRAFIAEAWTEVETGLTLAGLQKLLSRFRDDPATFWEPS